VLLLLALEQHKRLLVVCVLVVDLLLEISDLLPKSLARFDLKFV
jgi:hypothetical protein